MAESGAERGPQRFRQIEMAAKVEQGDLANAAIFAAGGDAADGYATRRCSR